MTNTIESVLRVLESTPELIVSVMRELPKELRKRRPAPEKWSAHEHACHLADVHALFFLRLDLMLQENHPRIKPFFPDESDALLNRDLEKELQRFVHERQKLLQQLKSLTPEQWQRTAEHGEYKTYSVFIMFRHLAMHDLLHGYRIEELLLKKEW